MRKRPDPRPWRGNMTVDLRPFGFGQRYVIGPESISREEAICLSYELLARLRREGMAEAGARDLFADRAPELAASVLDAWQAQKRYDNAGAARWGATYARAVRAELGAYRLADFAPPDGTMRLTAYVRELEKRGLSGRTIRNRLCLAEQVFRFAVERGWLASAPLHPRMPPKAAPVFHWVTEPMFRHLRGAVYDGLCLEEMRRCPEVTDAVSLRLYVERRRLYLSWLFYTGVHHADADSASADQLFIDGRAYIRHNAKSARCVADEQFEMPDPLHADLTAYLELLGRPLFPGELFTGGPWANVSRVMQKAAKGLKFPHGANPSILRRSYAREMFARGYTVREVADRMGHVDERMLKEIYVRTPRAAGHARSRWQSAAAGANPGTQNGMARVLSLRENAPAGENAKGETR